MNRFEHWVWILRMKYWTWRTVRAARRADRDRILHDDDNDYIFRARMNKDTRKQISKLIDRLTVIQTDFDAIKEEIDQLADAEREKFDNMSDTLQQTEQGQSIDAAADALRAAHDALDANIEDAISSLDEATA